MSDPSTVVCYSCRRYIRTYRRKSDDTLRLRRHLRNPGPWTKEYAKRVCDASNQVVELNKPERS